MPPIIPSLYNRDRIKAQQATARFLTVAFLGVLIFFISLIITALCKSTSS